MLYVQQSLGPGEEILAGTTFHWMYTVRAVLWIIFGVALGVGLASAAIWWIVNNEINATYVDLPADKYWIAWREIVADHGGYRPLIWSLPLAMRFGMMGCFLMGMFFFMHLMIVKATTEIAVTNKRIVYKKGLIARHVGEIGIDRIEGVSVNQSIWGRIWGYGTIIVRGMGVGEVILPDLIEEPIRFNRAIQEAKTLLDKGKADSKGQREDF